MSFKLNFGRGVVALALAGAAVTAGPAFAADHRDGAASVGDPSSDINDVYSFMTESQDLVVAMTVSPFAAADTTFSPEVQFVWHVDSYPSFAAAIGGVPAVAQTQVHCEFDEAQMAQCWVHRDGEVLDYVMGDAGLEDGVLSESGAVRLFAGLRSDPFYFYLSGFNAARGAVISAVEGGQIDFSNSTLCPALTDPQIAGLLDALTADGGQAQNDFLDANTLGIVLEIDKALFVDDEATTVSVHASTHAKP